MSQFFTPYEGLIHDHYEAIGKLAINPNAGIYFQTNLSLMSMSFKKIKGIKVDLSKSSCGLLSS